MLQIENTVISLDVIEQEFICDLQACLGACCIEGDAGAPLEEDEKTKIEEILPLIWDDLSPAAQEIIKEQGVAYIDEDKDLVTSIVNGKDCVFTCYEKGGMCHCAIEKAYREGKTDFYKPVSCHLYPIRVDKYPTFSALNYHKWKICGAARVLGNKHGVKVYEFLKEPLIRKFGESWYQQLDIAAKHLNSKK
ncbi:MAG: DUF3109 family protein [Bacteroidales bacterium]